MLGFNQFVDKKGREAKKQLTLIKNVLEKGGMNVGDFLEDDDPYIFVHTKNEGLTFDGVRIYKIGNSIAFRVQKEEETHPYGRAYPLNIEDMFKDLVSDEMEEEKAGKEVMEAISKEIQKFFEKSSKAERDMQQSDLDKNNDSLSKVMVKSTGTDYANQVHNKSPGASGPASM